MATPHARRLTMKLAPPRMPAAVRSPSRRIAGRGGASAYVTQGPEELNRGGTTACECVLSRRSALACASVLGVVNGNRRSAQALAETSGSVQGKYSKTGSGVPYEEVALGSGLEAEKGDKVVIDYVMRRSNGYFIYSTLEGVSFQPLDVPTEPFRFTLGDSEVIPALADVVGGMRVGGERRALVPPSLGYSDSKLLPQPPTFGTRRQLLNHAKEPLLFEVRLTKVVKAP